MSGAVDTLLLPLESGDISWGTGTWLFLGAQLPKRGFSGDLIDQVICEQPIRGRFLDLHMAGLNVENVVSSNTEFAGALVLIGRHRAENELMVARAKSLCEKGATIVVAGDKTSGIGSLKKRLAQANDIKGAQAKHHATVFWFSNDRISDESVRAVDALGPVGFETAPGMFSSHKIDQGSALLSKFIDSSIRGAVADFGAGWGYLSREVALKSAARSLDLYESHWPSLQAAKQNLRQIDKLPIIYHWHDVTREPITRRYDCVVMNPPFHEGRKTQPALGETFIEVAARSLSSNGRLLMVANSGLPYEKKLSHCFARFKQLEKGDGFKVLLAEK